MLLVPGIGMTNAIRDMFTGDTISGTSSVFTEALLLSLALAWGFARCLRFYKEECQWNSLPYFYS